MFDITIQGGPLDRTAELVDIPLTASQLADAGLRGNVTALVETTPGASSEPIAAQYDARTARLSALLPGTFPAHTSRQFRIGSNAERAVAARGAPFPATLEEKLDRITFIAAGHRWATYNLVGGRRPYFWPLLGPAGATVVRGQGSAEHPHHTGMGISYGGHSEGGSSNIWSDWDEDPYGPGGRMLHRGFRQLTSGPVFSEVVQDLTYVNTDGDVIASEVRTIRSWWASSTARFLDFHVNVVSVTDAGPRPFLIMARLATSFDIPKTGKVTNSLGYPVPPAPGNQRTYRATWVDGSGPTGDPPAPAPAGPPEEMVDQPGHERHVGAGKGPWNGLAVFDHPSNSGYPGTVGKFAVPQQITQVHYPPAALPDGPFSFQLRVFVHDGDADTAHVPQRAASYQQPVTVTVTTA